MILRLKSNTMNTSMQNGNVSPKNDATLLLFELVSCSFSYLFILISKRRL